MLVVVFTAACLAPAQGVPCSEAKLQYYYPTPDIAKHLFISTAARGTFDSTKKLMSEIGGNRWSVTTDAVDTKEPPWSTTIFIGNTGSDEPFLKISVLEHGNSLTVKFINDRLLLIEVWWGRFGVSDWMIDVDRHKLVYDELVNYYETYNCTDDSKKSHP